jgi:hypothetical protein
MADILYEVRKFLSNLFNVPSAWFRSPVFIIYLILPFITTTVFFYMLLTKHVRLFRHSNAVNLVISGCLAFSTIPLIAINPSFSIGASVIAATILSGGRITGRRLLLAFVAGAVAWGLSGVAASFLSSFHIS